MGKRITDENQVDRILEDYYGEHPWDKHMEEHNSALAPSEEPSDFDEDELEVIENCLFRRQIFLEESNLTEARCYGLILSARKKISKIKEKNSLQHRMDII